MIAYILKSFEMFRYMIKIVPKSNDMHTSNFITLCKAIRTQTKSDFHPQADFIVLISSLSWGWTGNSFTLDNKKINTYTIRFTTLTAVKYIMTFSSFSLIEAIKESYNRLNEKMNTSMTTNVGGTQLKKPQWSVLM